MVFPEITRAETLLRKHRISLPINIDEFASRFLDIQEDKIPGSVDGIFLPPSLTNSRPTIIINSKIALTRRRFTKAHELGHFFIPWHIGTVVCHSRFDLYFDDYMYREIEAEANRFASELLMPRKWLKQMLKNKISITNSLDILCKSVVSLTAATIAVSKVLPSGYVLVEVNSDDIVLNSFCSDNTVASPPPREELFDSQFYESASKKKDEFNCSSRKLIWFYFENNKKLPKLKSKENSTEIIKQILEANFTKKQYRQRLLQRINGVIGSANNRNYQSVEEFYSILLQRFSTNNDLSFLIDYRKFKTFLAKKSLELAKRKEIGES